MDVPSIDGDEDLLRKERWSLTRSKSNSGEFAIKRSGKDSLRREGSRVEGRKGSGVDVADITDENQTPG